MQKVDLQKVDSQKVDSQKVDLQKVDLQKETRVIVSLENQQQALATSTQKLTAKLTF